MDAKYKGFTVFVCVNDISMGAIIYSVNHSPIYHNIIPLDCEEENEYFDPRPRE